MSAERIAIVGMGGVFPSAPTPERLWALVCAAADTARDAPPERWLLDPDEVFDPSGPLPDHVYSRRGCFVEDFSLDPAGLDLPPDLLAGLDPVFHLTLQAGRQAFQAGVTHNLDRRRIGVILGNIALPTERASALARAYLGRTFEEKVLGVPAHRLAGENGGALLYGVGLPAGVLARALGLGGGSFTLDAACASSLYALKLAVDELRAGRADAMLAGGVSRPDCLYTQMGFSQLRALSPSGRASPFDARADGLVVGEGVGVFLLKRLADAQRDGDRILGVIAGVGLSNDVGGGLLAPNSEGQLRAMRAAYREAGWQPCDVDLIECHATGTPVGDAVEARSLRALWEGSATRPGACVLGSVKSTVGHVLTAAGAAGVCKVLSALEAGVLPPTANFTHAAPALELEGSPFRVLRSSEAWERRPGQPRRAAVSAFGFGGINAHLLIEEAPSSGRAGSVGEALLPRMDAVGEALLPRNAPEGETGVSRLPGMSPIAIVALDARFGPWDSLRAFQERVLGGGPAVEPQPPRHWWGVTDSAWFRQQGLAATPFAGFYVDAVRVDAARFRIPPRELEEMLPQQLLILQAAAEALTMPLHDEERLRTGVFIGLGIDLNTTNFHFRWSVVREAEGWALRRAPMRSAEQREQWTHLLREAAGPALSANRTMGALGSIAASRIARELRLGGPGFTICSEESSGLRALEIAVRALQRGELDTALVGAVDLAGDVRAVLATHRQRPFSPSGQARPFDVAADGTVCGEGAAVVVLKRLDDAVRAGDRIYAVIRGVGVAGGVADPVPPATAYREALMRAYREADVLPVTVAHVEAHGSGHAGEDRMEAEALAAFFGPGRTGAPLSLGSARADVGHAGAASGLASLVKACLCLDQQVLPPLRNLHCVRPELAGPFLLPRTPQHWLRNRVEGPRRAGVSSFSADGNCAHVILEEWQPATPARRASEGSRESLACAPGLYRTPARRASERGEDPSLARRAGVPMDHLQPLGTRTEALFVIAGHDPAALEEGLHRLHSLAAAGPERPIEAVARDWHRQQPGTNAARAVALVVRDRRMLLEGLAAARHHLQHQSDRPLPETGLPAALRDRIFYAPAPLGPQGELAFVYPGSGNDFPGMGSELAVQWPEVLRKQDSENDLLRSQYVPEKHWQPAPAEPPSLRERIIGQVALGSLVTDLLLEMGVRPRAAIGYSLGESAALFALRAWTGRDHMLRALNASSLFVRDLAGPCDAARRAWGLPEGTEVRWSTGVVERTAEEVRAACAGVSRAYLLIVNGPCECVVGGERDAVAELVQRLGCKLLPVPDTTTLHCPVVRVVADAYLALHRLPATPPGVRFYSTALAHAYEVTEDSAAEAILAQALDTIDFTAVIEAAYRDGVRLFVETGPGGSCNRLIDGILGTRPHRARSACVPGGDGVSTLLRLLALLAAERVPLDLHALYGQETAVLGHSPPSVSPRLALVVATGSRPFRIPELPEETAEPTHRLPAPVLAAAVASAPIAQAVATQEARGQAHAAYLRFADAMTRTVADSIAFQTTLLQARVERPRSTTVPVVEGHNRDGCATETPVALDRDQCLEFAVGSCARVVGPAFAEVDTFPTRVRLPDEPLMLVDRILRIEGEPRSLTHGRVVTEHDVRAGAWYLDGGRMATCIAVEAGQADLFLSGYLGIDFRTRGLAVYRLLDAVVTFHRGLPQPGQTVRYDIHIDRFFRQGETYLFRFRFEGTVDGERLLTMTDGCAGFFSAAELAAGKGVVQTELDRRPQEGVQPNETELPPLAVESYDDAQVDALRRGDLAACFGERFAGLRLADGLRLPGGRMRLVQRVPLLDPHGGRYGIGLIRGEADVSPDAWFLTCHFVDDRVMPGTLMYECCLHTLRIYLLRLGWLSEDGTVACEPVPGVASRLRCRGQVTEATRRVTYEVVLKERSYRPEPYVVADALLYADGKLIVEIVNLSLRLTGLSREAVAAVWQSHSLASASCSHHAPRDEEDSLAGASGLCADSLAGASGWCADSLAGASGWYAAPLFDRDRILAFCIGKPSEAFGERYRVFDEERFIARLPGPPYLFIDRILRVEAEPWQMRAGGNVAAQYDVPAGAWYFQAERQPLMPFAVLLEVPLQVCGWLAAYLGSALTAPDDLHFRNLEGSAELFEPVGPHSGPLTTRVTCTRVASSGGMIIQGYDFEVHAAQRPVYRGTTVFGFFPPAALAQQVGLRDVKPYEPGPEERQRGRAFAYPRSAPFPDEPLRMIDRVELLVADGGPNGLGFVQGVKQVVPEEWFFKAHFYQDPVWPGSLGLEAFVQLLKVLAAERWEIGEGECLVPVLGVKHSWRYRGQVIPSNRQVTVQAVVTACEDAARRLTADGLLLVDGRLIYQMTDFTLGVHGCR